MVPIKQQIAEDIKLIQKDWIDLDRHIRKNEYAFNYWVLSRLYSLEEQLIPSLITEYNDKSIDCFVHYDDSKELFIIQNKYYDDDTILQRKDVSDFLTTPLNTLFDNKYSKSKELQKLFNDVKNDSEYKIFFHFFITNNKRNLDSDTAIKNFNNNAPVKINPLLRATIFYLDDIAQLFYGDEIAFKEKVNFKYTISTKTRGNTLRILPKEYDLPEMSEAYYMLTPVSQLYLMYKEALNKKYPLFEENIREYLGKNSINKGIIETLKDKKDRSNFFYYNNGVTIICEKVETPSKTSITVIKPQIINGCQTVSSIFEVLSDFTDDEVKKEFHQVFVMTKILLFDKNTEDLKPSFYRDIVRYTNRQNAINEAAFGAKKSVFYTLQQELKERGFLLLVKPSDKNTFTDQFSELEVNKLLAKANRFGAKIGIKFDKTSDLFIPLEKLLQVYLGFVKDGYYSFQKKNSLLRQSSEIYKEYSLRINQVLSHDNLIRLYLIYLKADFNRKESEDRKTPIPYYVIGFLGRFIKNKDKLNLTIQGLFEANNHLFGKLFEYLGKLTTRYRKSYGELYGTEYTLMVKQPIDESLLDKQIDTLNDILLDKELKLFFESLY
jgi:AIPR protein